MTQDNLVFLFGLGGFAVLLWKLGKPLMGAALGIAVLLCALPRQTHQIFTQVLHLAGLPSAGAALNGALTLLIPVLAILVMFGWRGKRRG